jgi:hypothetical protein
LSLLLLLLRRSIASARSLNSPQGPERPLNHEITIPTASQRPSLRAMDGFGARMVWGGAWATGAMAGGVRRVVESRC